MTNKVILSAKELSIGYPDKKGNTLLHTHLNFSLRRGELTCLIGPNGIGKSTLLRTIALLQPQLDGEITLLGKSSHSYSKKECARTISIVLTEKPQVGGLTVNEIVAMGRHPYTNFFGRLTENDNALITASIQAVGLEKKRNSYIAELSDGERQKAMIAKALVQESPLIILDEPTAFLDIASRIEIIQLLHEIASQQNKAILLSTHDIEQTLTLADQLWILSPQGLQCGMVEDLVLNQHLDSLFNDKKIGFDAQKGTFSHTPSYSQTACLTANSELLLHWGINFLHRLNIDHTATSDNSLEINIVRKDEIKIKQGKQETIVQSFESARDWIVEHQTE